MRRSRVGSWGMATGAVLALTLLAPGSARAQIVDPGDFSIYSTASGGGALTTDSSLPPAPVFPSVCLGAFCLYSATDPGFITRDESPGPGFFPLAAGTTVTMEIVAMADEVSVLVGANLLDEDGEAASLGTALGLHLHPTWQVTVPASGTVASSFPVTFRLTAGAPYAASADYTVTLTLPTPAPTPTPAATATPAPTAAPTATPSPAPTPRPTATPAATFTPGPTPSTAPTIAPTPEPTPSAGATATPAASPGATATPSPTVAATAKPLPTSTPRATASPGATPSPSPSPSQGTTPRPTSTATPSPTPTARPTHTPPPAPGAVVPQPASRGDQVLFYFDARDGFTSLLSLANAGAAALDVLIDVYAEDLTPRDAIELSLPAGGSRTFDVGELRDAGVVSGPGLAIAYAVDASGAAIVTGALTGNFTVANLATGSAWGAPAAARSARRANGDGSPAHGTVIDGVEVLLDQIRPDTVELAVYHDPDSLESAAAGGNQLVFVSFDDVGGQAPEVRSAAMRWIATASRNDGAVLSAAAFDTSGVDVSHLEAVVGPGVRGAAGHLELTARTPWAGSRLVFFAQSLGTFATGYLLPPAR